MTVEEIRTFTGGEIRVDGAEGKRTIRGSLRFNALSVPLGAFMPFREKIAPGAFDSVLNDDTREVMAYWGHDINMPLGRRSRGTLRVSKTDTLLKFEADAPDTTWGRDAVTSIERGDVQGISFRFRTLPGGDFWEEDKDRNLIRTLTNVELEEVSPTAEPAYQKSSASVRSMEAIFQQHEQEIAASQIRFAEICADRQRRDRLTRSLISRQEKD